MGALGLLVRHSTRTSRREILATALIVALAGGVALAALAGARRTASAFPRYLEASHASDVAVQVGPVEEGSAFSIDTAHGFATRAASIDGVEEDASYIGLEAMFPVVDGELSSAEVVGSLDGRYIDVDSVAISDGRLPRSDRVDEVLINEIAASYSDLGVGDDLTLQARGGFGEGNPLDAPILAEEPVVVVGIGLFPTEVLSDDFDRSPRILATPALTELYREDLGSYLWQGLRLSPGTDVDRVIADYASLVGEDNAIIVQRTDQQATSVQRAIRPVVTGLGVFGLAALVAALTLGTLAGLRLSGQSTSDAATLRALGLRPSARAIALGAPAVSASAIGALGAMLLATALSPLAPIGGVRDIEPNRGVDLDVTMVVGGGVALGAALALVAVFGARVASHLPEASSRRRVRVVSALAAAGAPPASVVGAHQALGENARSTGVPARSTIAACAVSVIAIVIALVFGASVRGLLDDTARYGWASDMAVSFGGGYESVDPDGAAALADDPAVDAVAVGAYGQLALGGRSVSAMGILVHSGPPPVTLLSGTLPEGPDDVALGSTTAQGLGLVPGDLVEGKDGPALRVTGLVAMPAVGQLTADHPGLGRGAVLTVEGLRRRNPAAYPVVVFVDVDGELTGAAQAHVIAAVAKTMTDGLPPEAAEAYVELRPGEIRGLGPAVATSAAFASVLGLAAVVALVLTLGSTVRRHARTFATLRALGFDARQVRASVRWQTNVTMLVALVVGVPLGFVVGRVAWMAFASDLGAVSTPVLPILPVTVALAGLVVLANAVGEGPARRAARMSVQSLREA
ncbi:MAG: FtsX-like permease family protein [Acidimicrobiales bacterium]